MKRQFDLRSDTVTKPSQAMREAMANAEVGDDVYNEDPSVNALEEYVAQLCQKEAALFVPSGTMGNQLAIMTETRTGDEILIDSEAHIYYYETAAPSILSRVQLRPFHSNNALPNFDELEHFVRDDIYYLPTSSMLCLENTHNRYAGAVIDKETIKKGRSFCDNHNLHYHCDGARIWNAAVTLNCPVSELTKDFDTISVCFSKGLGAPVGSALVGSKETIKKALKLRKILGGGMRQAGIIAQGALFALQHNYDRIVESHTQAKALYQHLNGQFDFLSITQPQTNIILFQFSTDVLANQFLHLCKEDVILGSKFGVGLIRFVFHLDISSEYLDELFTRIINILKKLQP
ncbi:MAG: aminotransferase class I/II-fold pyridoxal phosphate-dependent enzyme [Candidatus Kapabacteria bacterium]|nr:aminotransferase class I/II-fold pyridoxal phosphate-dependent enzyme [Candidatus Kapabacteria bacterium]